MILLDDAQSTAANPSSRVYNAPLQNWRVLPSGNSKTDRRAVKDCLEEITLALDKGQYLVAAFAYELGRLIHHLPQPTKESQGVTNSHPLIEAWAFQEYQKLSKEQMDHYIATELKALSNVEQLAGVMNLQDSISEDHFCDDIEKIQEYIRSGDTYQINHTYRITGDVYGAPLALYSRLRERQPGRFGAYIAQDHRYLLSQSPELFIERQRDTLKAMPMKGTASALSNSANSLSDDPKNQAENVMIVDLLRNDLSRICLPNTVKVPHLFQVARHGDVLQMTSTVQGQIKPDVKLHDILNAVFPCGSVTGAPKKRSMEIIQELEQFDRGYYCGALGWLDPNGDFAFSVPIRTIEIEKDSSSQAMSFTLGVGAGITIDSDAKQEWYECHIKSAFLTELPSNTGVFETIAVLNKSPQRLESHLDRMQSSALALRIPFDRERARAAILNACTPLDQTLPTRLRLDLAANGDLSTQCGTLDQINEPVKIFWAKDILPMNCKMSSSNPLLKHKVSARDLYDLAWQKAVKLGGFDALFVNEQGFVTEGGRSSVFIKPANRNEWLTPPISAGVLPGIMRKALLADPSINAREANLTIQDILMAKEIMLSNALRGAIKAHF
ncbi:bifunctional aminodeoxychorismate synthase component I/aminodeoxychorismate lyase [Polynucleobacter tropicus]|uniref:Bifunctional aminodeoxychorismate synthase component I/aminodeoxychorismate lyase n=1 Tax=Polynucleobacter tropicus TaxID=1743174 RepID=A0A6M9PQR1_9BURK|nr:bifunctional anthranilate synthase component I family protein/class IV aminotransferase [Polynucleobacter tropicus]QKM64860.1 bifunctional aminodeoxychorismate synthase component I/aminodeoxychorismate lyase [Polynucleobacter tropicus]